MDKQAYFKMMGLCKDLALKLPKGTLSRIGGAILGAGKAAINPQTYRNAYNAAKNTAGTVKQTAAKAGNAVKNTAGAVKQTAVKAGKAAKDVATTAGKVAVPVGAAAGGTVAMNLAHNLGALRGAAQARNLMADKATAAYNRGLQQGAANKASQPGFWQRLLDYIQGLFK